MLKLLAFGHEAKQSNMCLKSHVSNARQRLAADPRQAAWGMRKNCQKNNCSIDAPDVTSFLVRLGVARGLRSCLADRCVKTRAASVLIVVARVISAVGRVWRAAG